MSLAEAQQAALAHFDSADANKDGKVTPEERRARVQGDAPQPNRLDRSNSSKLGPGACVRPFFMI